MTTHSPYEKDETGETVICNAHAGIEEDTEYPKSLIPWFPVLSRESLKTGTYGYIPSILDAKNSRFVTSGRTAIALALQQMKIGPNDKVLVPAYHCASMVEPVIWAGAEPVFYKIFPDTSVDLEDIQTRIDGSIKLLMATHYFGFPQNLSKLRAFCDANGIFLLEDCAHCFFGEHCGQPVGSFGDYAIGSSMKFFPIYDGGCLVSSRHKIGNLRLRSAGLGFELKAAFNALERSFEYGRLQTLKTIFNGPLRLKNFLWGRLKHRSPTMNVSLGPQASDGGFGFETKWLDKRASLFSLSIIKLVCKTRLAAKRRANYITLHKAMVGLPGCRPLFPELPDGVFPWLYPLITDEPQSVYSELRNAGVPVVRFGEFLWPGVDEKVCPVSVDLSKCVMQFPCHQELSSEELNWMIEKIRAVILGSFIK
jgi:perosamine synthetase